MNEMTTRGERIEAETKAMEVQVEQAIAAIRDQKSCDIASDLARQCADWIDKIDSDFDESLTAAKRAVEVLNNQVNGYKAPYIAWKAKLSNGVASWRFNERRRVEEDNRKAIEKANQEAKEKAEREAAKLEKRGDIEGAALVRSEPPTIAPVLKEAPKNKGVVDKTTWVVDIYPSPSEQWKLIKFLVDGGPGNMGAIMLNPAYLKKLAALRHEEMKTWPGITVRPVHTSEIRRDNRANG